MRIEETPDKQTSAEKTIFQMCILYIKQIKIAFWN